MRTSDMQSSTLPFREAGKVKVQRLKLCSKAFANNNFIPAKYSCEGEEVSPPFDIDDIPSDAKSFILIMEEPDVHGSTMVHWFVYNIPITRHLAEDETPGDELNNDFGQDGYMPPCPPSGTHRFIFKLFALDTVLKFKRTPSRQEVEEGMEDHIIGYGELIGFYRKHHEKRN